MHYPKVEDKSMDDLKKVLEESAWEVLSLLNLPENRDYIGIACYIWG